MTSPPRNGEAPGRDPRGSHSPTDSPAKVHDRGRVSTTQAESRILSAILSTADPDLVRRCDDLRGAFTHPGHGAIFAALSDMVAEGRELSDVFEVGRRSNLSHTAILAFSLGIGCAQASAEFEANLSICREAHRQRKLDGIVLELREVRATDSDALEGIGRRIDLIRREATGAKFGLWPDPVRASDLCAKPAPQVQALVESILAVGGVAILSGPSKGRKTFTALDASVSVASGAPWLGMKTRKGIVLYLNFELSEGTLHRRLESICRARGIAPPPDLLIWNLRGRTVDVAGLAQRVAKLSKDTPPALIVLDPLYKVSANSGADENSNDGQARILSELEGIARETGSALLILHHFAKGNASEKNAIDRGSGAGALARAPDAVLTLTEHEDEDVMVLEAALRDFPPLAPLSLRWTVPVWTVDGSIDPSKLKKKTGKPTTKPASELLAKLRDGMTNLQWLHASGWPKTTYREKRDELVSGEKVENRSGCYYAKAP